MKKAKLSLSRYSPEFLNAFCEEASQNFKPI